MYENRKDSVTEETELFLAERGLLVKDEGTDDQ